VVAPADTGGGGGPHDDVRGSRAGAAADCDSFRNRGGLWLGIGR
jgi:hypothetical protein